MLIDQFERTSVSTINAGIAGDNLLQMEKRAYRDVIRYQPDLVLINVSLNWDETMGSAQEYKKILQRLVRRIKTETDADIILLTPNGNLPNTIFGGENAPTPTTGERVAVISARLPMKKLYALRMSALFLRSNNWKVAMMS